VTKIATTPELISMNERAVKQGANRALSDETIERLDPEGLHVVYLSMLHSNGYGRGDCLRIFLLIKFSNSDIPREGIVDVDIDQFNNLRDYAS
jgi:hypothetical protein